MDENNVIHLELEDGKKVDCSVLAVFEVESKEYIALLPDEEETVYIYKYIEENGEPILSHIESDEEYDMVSHAFMEICEEDEDIEEIKE
ncbi:DUF1292 domain-containing protein [Clostridiaceae bacterium M8S5]|nr:DUF1292 domain-containing protein [Clostridiaceae bacterium M8S5]